jgi:hypothetical protein
MATRTWPAIMAQERQENPSDRTLFPSNRRGRSAIQKKLYRLMKAMNAAGGSLDRKFFCQKVTPALEFVTGPSEIGVFAKEGKQEILRGDHANRDDALIR